MTATAWVQTLSTGAVGSIVGLLGVYLAFRLTTRREQVAARESRTAESVAQVIVAANELQRRLTSWQFLWVHGALAEFALASQLFVAREIREHREVALWLLDQNTKLAASYNRSQVQRAIPLFLRNRAMASMAHTMGIVVGTLVDWQAGTRPASWFASELQDEQPTPVGTHDTAPDGAS
ncbi:hypothetical protein GALL_233150 [mine drainage metagenome]|uniref:Uncharacterized protein n=1 Tax=mine drainage metagenome TaxID=410659 RepID=A0A1J5RFV4_9ZZZZ